MVVLKPVPLAARKDTLEVVGTEDLEESFDSENGEDLSSKVDALLQRPFDDVFLEFAELQKYILALEDATIVKEEFRHAWHPDAPAELRQVLEELIDPDAAAASAAAMVAFMRSPSSAMQLDDMDDVEEDTSRNYAKEWEVEDDEGRSEQDYSSMFAEDEEMDSSGVNKMLLVDEALCKSFDEAMAKHPELRQHINSQDEPAEVEEEFRQHWHPEAPGALRQVLEELLDPVAAKANAAATVAFVARMQDYGTAEITEARHVGLHGTHKSTPPVARSKL